MKPFCINYMMLPSCRVLCLLSCLLSCLFTPSCRKDETKVDNPVLSGTLSFEATGEILVVEDGFQLETILVGRLQIENGAVSGVIAFKDDGIPAEITGRVTENTMEFDPVTLYMGDLLLDRFRRIVEFESLAMTWTIHDGEFSRTSIEGEGLITQNEGGDYLVFHDHEFSMSMTGGFDKTPPQLDFYSMGTGYPCHPTNPIIIIADEPLNVEDMLNNFVLTSSYGENVSFEIEVDETQIAGGYTHLFRLRALPFLPIDTTSILEGPGAIQDLGGNNWTGSLHFIGPSIGETRITPTSFDDGDAHGFFDTFGTPNVEMWPEPYAENERALEIHFPGAWGLTSLNEETTVVEVRLTFVAFDTYGGWEDINNNPDWVFENLGYSLTAASTAGNVSFERNMLDRGFTFLGGGFHAAEPESIRLDVSEAAGLDVLITFSTRSFVVSPLHLEGMLVVDRVEFETGP